MGVLTHRWVDGCDGWMDGWMDMMDGCMADTEGGWMADREGWMQLCRSETWVDRLDG